MANYIPIEKVHVFLKKQAFATTPAWEALFLCLYGKQSCPNMEESQRHQIRDLLRHAMSSSVFSPAYFETVQQEMNQILHAPYVVELQKAIEETDILIKHFKSVSGKQLGAVDNLEKFTIKTINSDKSPQAMVSELTSAFASLVQLMAEDAKILDNLSKTDQLTHLGNRRGFDEFLASYAVPERGRSLFLMMLDIDHFKLFNDNYGHLTGDEVLALVATIIKKASNSSKLNNTATNYVARYGGEEFAIIMPSSNDEKCMKLAEFLRSRIQHYPLVIRNAHGDIIKKDVHITISIGIAEMHPSWLKDQQNCTSKLIEAVDKALYEGKKRGRNMICQHKAYKGANGKLTSAIL